jgi:hypothetical protein
MSDAMRLRDLIDVSADDVDRALKEHGGTVPSAGGFIASVAADRVNEALDQDITFVLATGWSKVKDVKAAAARSRSAPGTTEVVTLGKHEQTSTHHPVLALMIGEQEVAELEFTLELTATFKSVKLAISDGRIRSIAPGEASALARLKYKSLKLTEKPTPTWKLPGEIKLKDGVPVPGG